MLTKIVCRADPRKRHKPSPRFPRIRRLPFFPPPSARYDRPFPLGELCERIVARLDGGR